MATKVVRSVFWRKITRGDFFNIERAREAGPAGGGGQLYIDIPLGGGVSPEEFGNFISGVPLDADDSKWAPYQTQAYSASLPLVDAPLTLTPRRGENRRYRIANQNRQATGAQRHPAWSAERGFPKAPDNVLSPSDPRMPDISSLKIYIARTESGLFLAGFTDTEAMPGGWPRGVGLEVLFEPNASIGADGIIQIPADRHMSAEQLAERGASPSGESGNATEDVHLQARVVRRSAGRRPGGRGTADAGQRREAPRPDPDEAISIAAPRASEAEDWVECRLNKLNLDRVVQRIGHTDLETIPLPDGYLPGADLIVLDPRSHSPERFVEVKSTTGLLPASIRLTAAELERAKKCSSDGLPFDIWVVVFRNSAATGTIISGFEQDAILLSIDDLVSVEIEIGK